MLKRAFLGLAAASALMLAGCSSASITKGVQNITAVTTALVNANTALVQLNVTIINNLQKQAEMLAPFNCGLYNLGSAIIESSSAATKVNAYLAKNVAANVSNVAVQQICKAAGYPTNVTMTSPAPAGG